MLVITDRDVPSTYIVTGSYGILRCFKGVFG